MATNTKYRVEYNQYEILTIMEDGEFTTATGNYVISDTAERIKIMLDALNVNTDKLNQYL
jgi:hypothetical protein